MEDFAQEKIRQLLETGDLDSIKAFMEKDPLIMRGMDSEARPWSYCVALRGDMDLIHWTVEYSRADMNVADRQGRSFLFPLIESGNPEAVRYGVDRIGLNPLSADLKGMTCPEYAYTLGHKEIGDFLCQRSGLTMESSYKNPVRAGFSPDPSIVRVGEDYYMVNSSFIHFPGLPISHSKDLVHWETIGHVLEDPACLNFAGFDSGRGFWAPDISYYDGYFYVVVTLRYNDDHVPMRRQAVFKSPNPQGPYKGPDFLEEDGIDPSVFTEDGRRYMLLNRGCRIFEVSPDLSRRLSPTRLLYYGDTKRATEAPHLLKKDGFYYLFMAEGGTGMGHRINVARSEKLMGPYEPCPYNPILKQEDATAQVQRAGHGKPVETAEGDWYMVYLASRQIEPGMSALGRETFLDPITWTKDGWPLVNKRRGPSMLQALPRAAGRNLKNGPVRNLSPVTYFGRETLDPDWYFIRRGGKDFYRLDESSLVLKGAYSLPDLTQTEPILLHRLMWIKQRTELGALGPEKEGGMVGLLFYYDENAWLYLCVEKNKQNYCPRLIIRDGKDKTDLKGPQMPKNNDSVFFQADSDGFDYSLSVSQGSYQWEHHLSGRFLADEGVSMGKRFTGPGAGPFAYLEDSATFLSFKMEEINE
jgi:xylan 1,4-beta-xylosidase